MQILYSIGDGTVAHQYRDDGSHRLIVRNDESVVEAQSDWCGYTQPCEYAGYIGFTDYHGERVLAVQELKRQPELKPEPKPDRKPHFTRGERGFARRAANRMLTQEHREFPSESSNAVYTTRVMLDGKVMCDCRGWTIKKSGQPRQCKHTREVIDARATRTDGEYLYVAALMSAEQVATMAQGR